MEYKKHRSCIWDNCWLCFPIETGSKIIGHIGVMLNSINIIFGIIMIVSLIVNTTSMSRSNMKTTTECSMASTEASFYDDIYDNAMNLTIDTDISPILPDFDLNNNVINAIRLLIFSFVFNTFTLSSNIVQLM